MFDDRLDAGDQLAATLEAASVAADLVLGIPRGGVPVARAVADRLEAPLDLVAARKMRLPESPEYAVGAAAADGSAWVDEETVTTFAIDETYLDHERELAAEVARETIRTFRGDRPAPPVENERIVVVDDGLATGATARACCRQVRRTGASEVELAVPVGPSESLSAVAADVDAVHAVLEPDHFHTVGQYYRDFEDVSDEEVMSCLDWRVE